MRRSTDVFSEWNEAAFSDDPLSWEARTEAWHWLDGRSFVDGEWRVGLEDARLVAEMGMSLRLRQRRFTEAVAIGKRFFSHPDAEKLDPADRNEALFWLSTSLLCAEKYAEAAALLKPMLANDGWGNRTRRRLVAGAIINFAERMGMDDMVPAPVRELASDLLYDWPSFRRKAGEAEAAETLGELCLILEDVRSR